MSQNEEPRDEQASYSETEGQDEAKPGDFEEEVDEEEKSKLIAQVLELQNTLEELSCRVDRVREENIRLRSENQVLGQYIENLMSASQVFQPTQ